MRLALIWAMSRNRVIGAGGGLPWRLPDEMLHFQRTTYDKPVIMGRRTFAAMAEPLPRRSNIVLTRSRDFSHAGVEVEIASAFRHFPFPTNYKSSQLLFIT